MSDPRETRLLRAVIDTNVFVSALRSQLGASYKLLRLLDSGKFEINLSVPLIIEYEDAAKRLIGKKAGLKANAREVVFFGSDRSKEAVNFRGTNFDVEQQYGRSIQRDQALSADRAPFLAWALNGEPLTKHQGAPLRLIMPGWYGAPNVKWLSDIYAQEEPYLGKFQANWYRTLRGEMSRDWRSRSTPVMIGMRWSEMMTCI